MAKMGGGNLRKPVSAVSATLPVRRRRAKSLVVATNVSPTNVLGTWTA
jgi:hypothetical protein